MLSSIWGMPRASATGLAAKAFFKQPSHATLSSFKALCMLEPNGSAHVRTLSADTAITVSHSITLTAEQLQRELNYRVTMNIANGLQEKGLIHD